MFPEAERLQTPALVIRLDAVRYNLERTLEAVGGDPGRWRPHVKTLKIPAVLRLLLDRGLRRFKCATTREAAVLRDVAHGAGVDAELDLLVAIAHRGANLARLAGLAESFELSLLTEDPDHALEVRRSAPSLGLYVDLDPGFGRSGIPGHDGARLAATVEAAGDALRGLHCYEGHVRDADPAARRTACEPIYAGLVRHAERFGVRELVTSGTPTCLDALAYAPFAAFDHQVSPGTVVYWDTTSESFGIPGFRPAATVLTRVISRTGPRRATCDAGSKALDAASGDPCAEVVDRRDLIARRPSEEHLPLAALGALDAPAAGSLLELVPRHVCPTVNLATEAWLVDGEGGRRVAVAARGHEL